MEKRNYFDDNVSKEFFVDIIVNHIKRKPECFTNFLECAERNVLLYQQTNQKVFDLLERYGMPNRFDRNILAKDNLLTGEEYVVEIDLRIESANKTLAVMFELPCDYIQMACERIKKQNDLMK